MKLSEKKCVPCEGDAEPFDTDEAKKYLQYAPGWKLVGNSIEKEFKFKDFKEALDFVNKVGEIAEDEGHHPDILLHGWNKVKLTLTTHAINGLSENDFIIAAKIGELPKG